MGVTFVRVHFDLCIRINPGDERCFLLRGALTIFLLDSTTTLFGMRPDGENPCRFEGKAHEYGTLDRPVS